MRWPRICSVGENSLSAEGTGIKGAGIVKEGAVRVAWSAPEKESDSVSTLKSS